MQVVHRLSRRAGRSGPGRRRGQRAVAIGAVWTGAADALEHGAVGVLVGCALGVVQETGGVPELLAVDVEKPELVLGGEGQVAAVDIAQEYFLPV